LVQLLLLSEPISFAVAVDSSAVDPSQLEAVVHDGNGKLVDVGTILPAQGTDPSDVKLVGFTPKVDGPHIIEFTANKEPVAQIPVDISVVTDPTVNLASSPKVPLPNTEQELASVPISIEGVSPEKVTAVIRDVYGNELCPAQVVVDDDGCKVLFKPDKVSKHYADFSVGGVPIGELPLEIEVTQPATATLLPTSSVVSAGRPCSFPVEVTGVAVVPPPFTSEPLSSFPVISKLLVGQPASFPLLLSDPGTEGISKPEKTGTRATPSQNKTPNVATRKEVTDSQSKSPDNMKLIIKDLAGKEVPSKIGILAGEPVAQFTPQTKPKDIRIHNRCQSFAKT
jgi:hypothetical protein